MKITGLHRDQFLYWATSGLTPGELGPELRVIFSSFHHLVAYCFLYHFNNLFISFNLHYLFLWTTILFLFPLPIFYFFTLINWVLGTQASEESCEATQAKKATCSALLDWTSKSSLQESLVPSDPSQLLKTSTCGIQESPGYNSPSGR